MRIVSSVTSVSWIPSEAITGPLVRLPFDIGFTHYDEPPPDHLDDLENLLQEGRFRFANRLEAWIEVEDGRITGHGQTGGGHINRTVARVGRKEFAFQPTPFPDLRENDIGDGWMRFVQTAGGKPGIPSPRRVNHPPFVQLTGPSVWSTLALTVYVDGTSEHEVLGASSFPRHWIYDREGRLVQKSGTIDFQNWYRHSFGAHTPWGDEQAEAVVAEVESALEREMSATIMRPDVESRRARYRAGQSLIEQGKPGAELFLLLDGIVRVDVDGEPVAELGPGAILGERALLEGGLRTSTVVALTECRVAVAAAGDIDRGALAELAGRHRREEKSR